jgi:ubiquinone/menaquinone biosynthesis C-methylase UbiE
VARADAKALPFPNETFDAVACSMALMLVWAAETVLAEVLRVLVPGGRACSWCLVRTRSRHVTTTVTQARYWPCAFWGPPTRTVPTLSAWQKGFRERVSKW